MAESHGAITWHVWRLKEGKVTEFREYQGDEQREDRFWS